MTDTGLDCHNRPRRSDRVRAPHAVSADRLRATPDGMLLVSCWCERNEVLVKKELVGTATASCGLPNCRRVTR